MIKEENESLFYYLMFLDIKKEESSYPRRLCKRFLEGFMNVFKIFGGYVIGFWKVLETFSKTFYKNV